MRYTYSRQNANFWGVPHLQILGDKGCMLASAEDVPDLATSWMNMLSICKTEGVFWRRSSFNTTHNDAGRNAIVIHRIVVDLKMHAADDDFNLQAGAAAKL